MNSTEFLKYYRHPGLCGAGEVPLWEELLREYPWFQSGWMLYLCSLRASGDPRFEENLRQGALRIRDRRTLRRMVEPEKSKGSFPSGEYLAGGEFASGLGSDDVVTGGGASPESALKQQLIERFLAGGAAFGILPVTASTSPGIDLAEKAAEVTGDILTETFANLLVQQEKYQEAIEAFEELSLRYPGKSVYFAARIEEVKRIMNY